MIRNTTRPQALAWLLVLSIVSLVSACGGGGDEAAAVFSVSAASPQYSRTMTISVSGRHLSKGVSVEVDRACGEVKPISSYSDDSRLFTCEVTDLGAMVVRVRADADGTELARLMIDIPAPQVAVTLTLASQSKSFVLELDPLNAPLSTKNFLAYANGGFYRNTLFHRVVKDFVVQAGGYNAGPVIKQPTSAAIALESANGLKNLRGTLAMARTAEPDSATSQWYVNLVDNASLDYVDAASPGYAVFGRVVSGLDVIDEIAAVPVRLDAATGLTHLPVDNIVINSALQIR